MNFLKWEIIYIYLFAFATVLSFVLTPMIRRLAIKWNIVDNPGERKIHLKPKPYLGGTAIYFTFMVTVLGHLALAAIAAKLPINLPEKVSVYLNNVSGIHTKLIFLLLGGTLIYVVGTFDDIRGMRPVVKLSFQILAGIVLCTGGVRIVAFIDNIFITSALTIFWVVLLTNSFNFLDNMDGLSAGISVIIALVFGYLAYSEGQIFMTAILLVFAGSILGFLKYNLNPATIFMGDGGSMFNGFMIAALTMLATYYKTGTPTQMPILMPVIILGVPLFDTVSVLWIRFRNGKPLMQGDKNHFSHRLVALGMTQKNAVFFIYFITLSMSLGALLLRHLSLGGCIIILVQAVTIFFIIYQLEHVKKNSDN